MVVLITAQVSVVRRMLNRAVVSVVLLVAADQGAAQFWGRPQEAERAEPYWGRPQTEKEGAVPHWQQRRKKSNFQERHRYYSQDYYYNEYDDEYYGKFPNVQKSCNYCTIFFNCIKVM